MEGGTCAICLIGRLICYVRIHIARMHHIRRCLYVMVKWPYSPYTVCGGGGVCRSMAQARIVLGFWPLFSSFPFSWVQIHRLNKIRFLIKIQQSKASTQAVNGSRKFHQDSDFHIWECWLIHFFNKGWILLPYNGE